MNKESLAIFLKVTALAAVFFVFNFLIYQLPDLKEKSSDFIYPLALVYLLFLVFSLIIIAVLIKVGKKSKEQIGYAFLLLTGVKMALCYAFARPIITKIGENPTEKINFFVIFILFLAIEAYFTARLLNNKQ